MAAKASRAYHCTGTGRSLAGTNLVSSNTGAVIMTITKAAHRNARNKAGALACDGGMQPEPQTHSGTHPPPAARTGLRRTAGA